MACILIPSLRMREGAGILTVERYEMGEEDGGRVTGWSLFAC